MHSYELEGRGKVVVALGVIGVFLVWFVDVGLTAVKFDPQWWLSVPSFAGFYSALYWLFDRHVWGWRVLGKLGLVQVPNLNGVWTGSVRSSYDDYKSNYPVTVVIRQRWSQITVRLDTDQSQSRSLAATFRVVDLPCPELSYLYMNEPNPGASAAMNSHRGTVDLEFRENALEGHYYTGRGRMTNGIMSLTREQGGLKAARDSIQP